MKEPVSDKEKFFSKVSHDLRGSFTSILGFSEILNDPEENLTYDEVLEFVQRIGKQSKESFDLLVNFINWLKLENYGYGLNPENFALLDVLNELKLQFKKQFAEKNIKPVYLLDESVIVNMDYEILHSIISNIFIFLLKASCNGSKLEIVSSDIHVDFTLIKISSECEISKSSFLQNINLGDLNSDLSFPIIFAIKFSELCGGKFDFTYQSNSIIIELSLPKK